MSRITGWMDRAWYPKHARNWDDELFRDAILGKLQPQMAILDLGAGAGILEQMDFRGHVSLICGVDLDPRVLANPYLDEGRVSDAGEIPYPDSSFDLIFSCNVLEHLANPHEVFCEVERVLRPGGLFLFKTPNKWHYMPSIARLTPLSFHRFINQIRGRAEVDTFPTVYRANSRSAIVRLAKETSFIVHSFDLIEGRPEYMRMSMFTYLVGFLYERVVNAVPLLASLRILIIGVLKKQ